MSQGPLSNHPFKTKFQTQKQSGETWAPDKADRDEQHSSSVTSGGPHSGPPGFSLPQMVIPNNFGLQAMENTKQNKGESRVIGGG